MRARRRVVLATLLSLAAWPAIIAPPQAAAADPVTVLTPAAAVPREDVAVDLPTDYPEVDCDQQMMSTVEIFLYAGATQAGEPVVRQNINRYYGDWKYHFNLPDVIAPGTYTFQAVCSFYDMGFSQQQHYYPPATLTVLAPTGPLDLTPPVWTVPTSITETATLQTGKFVAYSATVTDNTGILQSRCAPASGSRFAIGTTTVYCDASDRFGNTASASFPVTVLPPAAGDTQPPTVSISSPQNGATYGLGASVAAGFTCADNISSGASLSCTGPTANGAAIDTATVGPKSFTVTGRDAANNVTTVTVSYTVVGGYASEPVYPDAQVTTDPLGQGATPAVPLQTAITVPDVSGTVTVTPVETPGTAPEGFSFFDTEVSITGPAATAWDPYVVTFTVDASALHDADGNPIAPADVQVFRNGTPVGDCVDATSASPDPCVAARSALAGGDAAITVRTSAFSTWTLGALDYAFTQFHQPVDAAPTVNRVRAGAAVPVKFGLTGDRGSDIFADGYPRSTSASCPAGNPDDIEQTVTAGESSLTYDSVADRYSYVWKTAKTWSGCRVLELRFRDGTSQSLQFFFTK